MPGDRPQGRALRAAATLLVVASLACPAGAENDVAPADTPRHIGEAARVCGTVASTHVAHRNPGEPIYLFLDVPYPNHAFRALIWGRLRPEFDVPPETLLGRSVCVTGTIVAYHGRTQIIVERAEQLSTRGDPGALRYGDRAGSQAAWSGGTRTAR